MAKAKQKREKKEQEKLRRAGRHLEWLVSVQGQARTPELGREIDQAWQEVLRRTLRTRQAFDEFCAQIDSIPAAPANSATTNENGPTWKMKSTFCNSWMLRTATQPSASNPSVASVVTSIAAGNPTSKASAARFAR